MSLPHAVIIAGGKGERLGGVRKADLRIGGRRLLDRVTEALGPVAGPLMISTGANGHWPGIPSYALAVADLPDEVGGPLAGLAAAVASLQARGVREGLLVSVAADTPFLPADFVARLQDGLGTATAAYAVCDDQFYPPNAIWRIEAISGRPLQAPEHRAPPSLKTLHRDLGSRPVTWAKHDHLDPFANVNTVGDLVTLGWMARDRGL